MAAIVLGIGAPNAAMLSMPPADWDAAARQDRRSTALAWRGATYSYDALAALRGGAFAPLATPAARRAQWDRCQAALDTLSDALARTAPDVLLVVGGDGEGSGDDDHPLARGLATVVAACAKEDGFALTLDRAPGFVVRRLLAGRPVPLIRLTFHPSPTPERCFAFGAALGRAVRAWDAAARVAVLAAGGLSHPAIDEDLDRRILDALEGDDPAHLVREPDASFRGGAAEIKNWIVAAGALDHAGLDMVWLDHVSCIRTEAGTGNAMAFAVWS